MPRVKAPLTNSVYQFLASTGNVDHGLVPSNRGYYRMRLKGTARPLAAAAVALFLSGCAVPPIVTVASFALDFASYGETGKTVADHGLSLVLQQDCAMLRILEGELCRPMPGETPETALVALEPMPDPLTMVVAVQADPMVLPVDLAYLNDSAGPLFANPAEPTAIAFVPDADAARAATALDDLTYLNGT